MVEAWCLPVNLSFVHCIRSNDYRPASESIPEFVWINYRGEFR
ncbi:unannotated protein [freshwater metagenome]|uniref:Unannotated protein n=1 Tax=freshwater metagenome TaxID=449393 RepID=A0A6J7I6K5_9ZZZZ